MSKSIPVKETVIRSTVEHGVTVEATEERGAYGTTYRIRVDDIPVWVEAEMAGYKVDGRMARMAYEAVVMTVAELKLKEGK